MKKTLSILLTIVMFQSQLFSQTAGSVSLYINSVAGASAAASAKTGGFNISAMVEAQVNEQSHKEQTTSNKASAITATGGNISLTAKKDITQVGSAVVSTQGDITYDAGNDVLIKASKDVRRTQDKNESYSASMTIGTGGVSGSVGFEQGGAKSTAVSYNNAVTSAEQGTVTIKSGGNTTLSGANVSGKNIEANIGGNLTVESLQDTYKSEGKQYGASVGVSGGGKDSSGVSGGSVSGHYGESKTDMAWVGQQTTLTGSESVNINVGGKTSVTGAVIANTDISYDKQGKIVLGEDKGNLTLNTKEFEYNDIKDKNYSRSFDYGGGVSIGKPDAGSFLPVDAKSVNMTFKNHGYEKEQINRATVGNGTIIVDGQIQTEDDLKGLNRDVTKSQEVTRDQITNQLDANLTVDIRFWGSVYDVLMGKEEVVLGEDGKPLKDKEGNVITRKKELSVVEDTKTIAKAVNEIAAELKHVMNYLTEEGRIKLYQEQVLYSLIGEYNELSFEQIREKVLNETGLDLNNKKDFKKYFDAQSKELNSLANRIEYLEKSKKGKTPEQIAAIDNQIAEVRNKVAEICSVLPVHPNYVEHKAKLDKKLVRALTSDKEILEGLKDKNWQPVERRAGESDEDFARRQHEQEDYKLSIMKKVISVQASVYNAKGMVSDIVLVEIPVIEGRVQNANFNPETQIISVNKLGLDYRISGAATVGSLVHEGEHAYQWNLRNSYINNVNIASKILPQTKVFFEVWRYGMYFTDSDKNYRNSPLEKTARETEAIRSLIDKKVNDEMLKDFYNDNK